MNDLRVEGGGEEMNGATLVMNTLLRKILPFFLAFIIDKFSQINKNNETKVTPPVVQGTEGGRASDLQSLCTKLKYENDRLEQYSRRESIRIFGIKEAADGREDNRVLEDKVLRILNDTGARVHAGDISVMHRIGKRNQGQSQRQGPRPVIVRFISRNKKSEILHMKKNLKNRDGYADVFIFEDVTRLRSKLLYFVKNLPDVGRAWTKDGQIFCRKKGPNNTILDNIIGPIDSADDLFEHLGVNITEASAEQLGLTGYVFL